MTFDLIVIGSGPGGSAAAQVLTEAGLLPGKAQNTPFDGRALEGRVLGTWKAGRRVFG